MGDEDRQQSLDHVSDRIINTDEINRMATKNVRTSEDENVVVVPNPSVSLMSQNTPSLDTDYDLPDISFRKTLIHLVSLSVCSLVLSTPFSTREVFGDTSGLIITLTSLFLYLYSLNTFLWSKHKLCRSEALPSLSYPSFVHLVFRDYGSLNLRSFTEFGVTDFAALVIHTVFALFLVCGCSYNFLLASESIRIVYNLWASESVDLELVMIWILGPLLTLCWLVRREHLKLVSVVAHSSSMLCIAAVFYESIYSVREETINGLAVLTQMPFYLFGFFFMLHALGSDTDGEMSDLGISAAPVALNSSEKEECRKLNELFAGIPVLLVYAVFGFRCSLRYGSRVEGRWANVPQSQLMTHQWALLANAFSLLFQYPLLVRLIFDLEKNSTVREHEKTDGSCSFVQDRLPKMALTVMVFLSIYHIPSVDEFLILGNVLGTVIDSFLFPGFILTLVAWRVGENVKVGRRCFDRKNVIIGFLALLMTVLGTMSGALDLIRYCAANKIHWELFE